MDTAKLLKSKRDGLSELNLDCAKNAGITKHPCLKLLYLTLYLGVIRFYVL